MENIIYVNEKVGIVPEGYPNAERYYSEEYVIRLVGDSDRGTVSSCEGGDDGREG